MSKMCTDEKRWRSVRKSAGEENGDAVGVAGKSREISGECVVRDSREALEKRTGLSLESMQDKWVMRMRVCREVEQRSGKGALIRRNHRTVTAYKYTALAVFHLLLSTQSCFFFGLILLRMTHCLHPAIDPNPNSNSNHNPKPQPNPIPNLNIT